MAVILKWKNDEPFKRELRGDGFTVTLHLTKEQEVSIPDSIWPIVEKKLSDPIYTGAFEIVKKTTDKKVESKKEKPSFKYEDDLPEEGEK